MSLSIYANADLMGAAAAARGAEKIINAISEQGFANIIVATGASQFTMLSALANNAEIDWSKVTIFHLDEYVGLPETHGASFRKYIKERFIAQLPVAPKMVYYVDGSSDNPAQTCRKLGEIIAQNPIDVCFMGIGENGHIAFNDPPANFDTEEPYIVVDLDEVCRKQQLGEGWFPTLEDVPKQAISMSVRQILKSKALINTVPDERKALALKNCFEAEMTSANPSSVIRFHADCATYCDVPAASMLSQITKDLCAK